MESYAAVQFGYEAAEEADQRNGLGFVARRPQRLRIRFEFVGHLAELEGIELLNIAGRHRRPSRCFMLVRCSRLRDESM